MLKIGNLVINSKVVLSPLTGVTDYVMRSLIREYSPHCLLTTEMISSEALVQKSDTAITYTDDKEFPCAWQIEGHKPEIMAKAAKILENKAAIIDINMGCPIKKIVNGNDGCSLMRNPMLAKDIVVAVKEAVKIPVTCKFRLGWSLDDINFVEFAQLMQSAGACAVTIHARTRAQMYSGNADWKILERLHGNIDIPYIANGDITSVQKAKECLEISKANAVSIGRAATGDLSLIARTEKYINEDIILPQPDLSQKIQMLKKHLDFEISFRGQEQGIKYFRKFYPYYIKGIKGGSEYRYKLVSELNYDNIINILNELHHDNSLFENICS